MLLLLLATVFASEKLFEQFKLDYNKNYTSEEEHGRRYAIFLENLQRIDDHNAKDLPYKFGITQFADLTQFEFAEHIKRGNAGGFVNYKKPESEKNYVKLPKASCDSVDWVAENKVTPVKDQGQCGSCWSFSTTGAIESRCAIATGEFHSLSEQELVDCDTQDSGCNGGLMDYGFEFAERNGGLCEESAYPYTSGTTKRRGTCEDSSCTKYCQPSSYVDVTSDNQDDFEAALCQGPVSIAIEADQSAFQLYSSGVLTGSCGSNLDHGVLAVGFGTDSQYGDYWKVKNSWGSSWGENGYIRLCRNCNMNCRGIFTQKCSGQCGLMQQASYPVIN